MKKIVILGTSHSTIRYSPSLTTALQTVGEVENLAAYGHGIDTYFPRVMSHVGWQAIFIIEAPHHTRYTEFMNEGAYVKGSYSTPEFWTSKQYMKHLAFYSKTVLLEANDYDEALRSSRQDLKALQRVKLLANQQLELEDNIIKCCMLDGFLKNRGHKVLWWTANNKLLHTYNYPFNLILDKPLFDNFEDKKLFSDGYHLDDQHFQPYVENHFLKEVHNETADIYYPI